MTNTLKILLCLLVSSAAVVSARAAMDSTGIYVEQVLHPQRIEERSLAIGRLVVLQEPASFPFLEAINNSNLYLVNGKAVTLGHRRSESEDVFTVYELFPRHRLLLNEQGQPVMLAASGLKSVEISRVDRLQLGPVVERLNLFNADAQKRTMAYAQLQNVSDTALMNVLSIALRS